MMVVDGTSRLKVPKTTVQIGECSGSLAQIIEGKAQ
jgi:hypothetical protein